MNSSIWIMQTGRILDFHTENPSCYSINLRQIPYFCKQWESSAGNSQHSKHRVQEAKECTEQSESNLLSSFFWQAPIPHGLQFPKKRVFLCLGELEKGWRVHHLQYVNYILLGKCLHSQVLWKGTNKTGCDLSTSEERVRKVTDSINTVHYGVRDLTCII